LPPLRGGARGIGLLCLLAAAAAELRAAEPKRPRGRFKLGPLHLTPRFEIRNAGVDTNVFNTLTDPIPDTSVVGRFALDGALPLGRRLTLTGNGYADLNYFWRESTESSLDYGGEGLAELQAGRFTVFAGGGGLQASQRFSIELTQRVPRHEKWVNGGLDLALTSRLSTRLLGSVREYEFGSLQLGGEDIRERLDRRSLTGGAELRYALTRKTKLMASAERIEDRFSHQIGRGPRRTLSHRFLGGFELDERALLSGRALAGIRQLPTGIGEQVSRPRDLALAVDAALRLGRFGRLELAGDRDVFYSAEGVNVQDLRRRSAYLYTRYRAEVLLGLPLELLGGAFAEWQEASFLLPQSREEPFRRVDRVHTFGGRLLRRLADGVSLGATVAWSQRVSNVESLAYRGLVYGAQAEVVP
jgi:hypothetical protein